MSNPVSTCCTCGYIFQHGQHGGHSCVERLLERIRKLQQIINEQDKILVCNGLISLNAARSHIL